MSDASLTYPVPRRDESVVEEHHGIRVSDPYRWMEDPDGEETKAFVSAQNSLSKPYIDSCVHRGAIEAELTSLWNYPKVGVPHREGNFYFFAKNSGLQNQSVIYKQPTLESDPSVFLDPNELSSDGTVSLTMTNFSEDGSIVAYGLASAGSDWFDVHFKNVETDTKLPEVLRKLRYSSVSWLRDGSGVFYGSYPEHSDDASGRDTTANEHQKLFFHSIGTDQKDDVLCLQFPDQPKWRLDAEVSDCGDYLLVCPQKDCRDNLVFFCDLKAIRDKSKKNQGITENLPLKQVVFNFECDYEYVTNEGSRFVFRTNKNAPNYSLIVIDLQQPEEKNWTILVKEHEQNVLDWATCVNNDKLVLCYMQDVKHKLEVRDLKTGSYLYDFDLDIGSVVGFSGKKRHSELFFKFSSMITPGIIYHVDMNQEKPTPKVFMETKVQGLDSSQFKVEQVFYPSKDNTRIPMFVAGRKDAKQDGSTPCLLYGYGGFNISLTPSFSITQLFFMKHFGLVAIPNIRGGGEYGEKWHNAGRLLNKQNGFDDFQCAAKYLVEHKYTSKDKLVIKGGSNGGLLVAACLNQRPELFGAGVAAVGVMDMLRFHKFTIGYAWMSDYGNPEEKDHFKNLLSYSPLHNIPKDGVEYPSILLTTADHDDRVVPSHSLKFIAQLQHLRGNDPNQKNPLLIRVETKAGHGAGKPTSKSIEEASDVFAFIAKTLKLDFMKD